MKKSTAAIALGALLSLGVVGASIAESTGSQVQAGRAVAITHPSDGRFILEWVHANGDRPGDVLACGERDTPDNNHFSAVFLSSDGGETWRRTFMDTSSRWVSEDSCALGGDGTAFFATGASLFRHGMLHHEYGKLHVFRSSDGGVTWKGPAVAGFVDWTSFAIDRTGGPYNGNVYVFGNATAVMPGHWSPFRPILRTSRDGGATFGGPVSPHPTGYRYLSAFAGGSTVLLDGTAIGAFAVQRSDGHKPGTTGRHSVIDVMASTDGGRSLQLRAQVADVHENMAWPSQPVEDRANDGYRGRLYLAWGEDTTKSSRVMLATSDDHGVHWQIREVFVGGTFPLDAGCGARVSGAPYYSTPRIAVNKDGVLAMSWAENGGATMRVAFSSNGGRSFGPSSVVSTCPANGQDSEIADTLFAVPFAEDEVAERRALSEDKPMPRPDFSQLGISLRIQGSFGDAPDIAADSSGTFHTLWAQPGDSLSLWTRTFRVSKLERTADRVAGHAGGDVTKSIAFEFHNLRYVAGTKTFSLDVVLENKGTRTIRGPVLIRGSKLHSNYGTPVVVDPTSQARDGDPIWDVSSVIPASGLAPGARSLPYTMTFRVRNFHFITEGDVVSFTTTVFGTLSPR